MARTEVYEAILQELADGELEELEAKIFHFLRRVYPAALTRYDLLELVFGYRPSDDENINNNTDDRKNREAIASMFLKGVPVVSTSGGAGYRLDIDLKSWDELVDELENRRNSISKKADAARGIVKMIQQAGRNAIPTDVPASPVPPKQLSFIGEGAQSS